MTYEVKVTIKDLDITPRDQKMLQKVKAELEKKTWGAGNVHENDSEMEFFERDDLQQDLHFIYYRPSRISVLVGGSSIDRDNLKTIERVFKRQAKIELDSGKLELEFDFYKEDTTYSQFGFFKSRFDIPRTIPLNGKVWNVQIHGYKWVN